MDEFESLSHSRWECKYHVVFIPKCRRKALYASLRRHLGEVFRQLAQRKECEILAKRAFDAGSCSYADCDPTKACGVASGGVHESRKECDPHCQSVRRTQAEFCGAEFLGREGILFRQWVGMRK